MKLHLGCGKRYISGFIHIDAVKHPHVDYVANVDKLEFVESNSVELIYVCHVLEHFKRADTARVLAEWNRILSKNGVLRITVPDFEAVCKLYSLTGDMKNVIGPLYGGQDYEYNFHYNAFDFKSLKDYLVKAGFKDIKRYDWRQTIHVDYDDYSQAYWPHMNKESGMLMSLNVEATKA